VLASVKPQLTLPYKQYSVHVCLVVGKFSSWSRVCRVKLDLQQPHAGVHHVCWHAAGQEAHPGSQDGSPH